MSPRILTVVTVYLTIAALILTPPLAITIARSAGPVNL